MWHVQKRRGPWFERKRRPGCRIRIRRRRREEEDAEACEEAGSGVGNFGAGGLIGEGK